MNRKTDYEKFVVLLNTVGEATPQGKPSPEKTEIYFRCLQDLSFQEIDQCMMNHLRHKKFFPTISEIRGESDEDLEIQAQEDYRLIDDLCQNFVFEGFGGCGYEIIKMKLEEAGKGYLFETANRFGTEIAYGTNSTATRAQVIKQIKFINHVQRKQLSGQEKKQIGKVDKLLDNVTKRI